MGERSARYRGIKRRDANHSSVAGVFEQLGFQVLDMSQMGESFPDLLVAYAGLWLCVEVKVDDGDLSPGQVAWHGAAKGAAVTVYSDAQALDVGLAFRAYAIAATSAAGRFRWRDAVAAP